MAVRLVWVIFTWGITGLVFILVGSIKEPKGSWYTVKRDSLKQWPKSSARWLPCVTRIATLNRVAIVLAIIVVGTLLYLVWQPLVFRVWNLQPPQIQVDTATLATLVGIIIAILSLGIAGFGYFMRELLERGIRDTTTRDHTRARGIIQNWMSYSQALMYKHQLPHNREGRVADEVAHHVEAGKDFARRALNTAERLNDEELALYAQNNLAYHIGARSASDEERRDALQFGAAVYRAADQYRRQTWKETYAWVLWRVGSDDATREEAKGIIETLLKDVTIPPSDKAEWRRLYGKLLT
jgi:hypothetical protein